MQLKKWNFEIPKIWYYICGYKQKENQRVEVVSWFKGYSLWNKETKKLIQINSDSGGNKEWKEKYYYYLEIFRSESRLK